jgi:adhesin transport system outer membrane protein
MSHRTAMLSFIILVVTAGHVMSQPLPATWAQEESSDLHSNRLALPALSLDETLRAAADTHPSVALKLAEQSSSEYGLEGARWQRWPGMSLSSSRGPFGNTLTEVQLEQPLWTGGRITANVNAAQARLEAARSSVAEAKQLIVERAVTAFADAMRLQDRLAGAQAAIADYEQLTAMIDRRVAGGVSPQNDGTTVRARLQQARSE